MLLSQHHGGPAVLARLRLDVLLLELLQGLEHVDSTWRPWSYCPKSAGNPWRAPAGSESGGRGVGAPTRHGDAVHPARRRACWAWTRRCPSVRVVSCGNATWRFPTRNIFPRCLADDRYCQGPWLGFFRRLSVSVDWSDWAGVMSTGRSSGFLVEHGAGTDDSDQVRPR
jgi:hypothetical protein